MMKAKNEITVDNATQKDVEQLAVLFDAYRVFYKMETDVENVKAFLEERISNKDSVIYAARTSDGVMTGFVQLYPIFSSTRIKRLWLLNDLYVSPAFRGLGISVKLIGRAKQHAAETKSAGLILETAKSNEIGNNLYLNADFVKDTDHNYYSWNP